MDRNFLYGIILLLSLTFCFIYIKKTDPNLFDKFMPLSNSSENWQNKDPNWKSEPNIEKKEEKPEIKSDSDKKSEVKPESNEKESPKNERNHFFKFFRCRP
jgi:hypothetical protein